MVAAPGLVLEAAAGKARGWLSSGICPDPNHKYGYHMANPRPGDYSLRGPLNRPVGSHCCAWDMQTRTAGARRYVRSLFDRIETGAIEPSTAELIGSWDGVNVWYWVWDRGHRVERYRGAGHDTWCHRAVFRSLATRRLGWMAAYDDNGYPRPVEEPDMDGSTYIRGSAEVALPGSPTGVKFDALNKPFNWWLSAIYQHILTGENTIRVVAAAVANMDELDDETRAAVDAARAELASTREMLLDAIREDSRPGPS